MGKIYKALLLLVIGGFLGNSAFSQFVPNYKISKDDASELQKRSLLKKQPTKPQRNIQHDLQCGFYDPFPETAGLDIIFYDGLGFQSGTNVFGDKQKANYFNLALFPSYDLLAGFFTACFVWVPDSSKTVVWRVFDGTSGTPGAQLTTFTMPLKPLADSADAGSFNYIEFPSPIVMPASRKFFISCDYSNLSIDNDEYFGLVEADSTTPYNLAWEQWDDDTWHPYSDTALSWGDSSVLAIFPVICRDVVTPVTMTSLSGKRISNSNKLYWSTYTENNNKGFEVQRSVDGVNFSTIAFVPSKADNGTSSQKIDYEFSDDNPLNSSNFYRLMQVDKNARANFSQILRLQGSFDKLDLATLYPNPAKNRLNFNLVSPRPGSVTVTINSISGSVVSRSIHNIASGDNNIGLNIQNLAPGSYILKVVSSDNGETFTKKFIKE